MRLIAGTRDSPGQSPRVDDCQACSKTILLALPVVQWSVRLRFILQKSRLTNWLLYPQGLSRFVLFKDCFTKTSSFWVLKMLNKRHCSRGKQFFCPRTHKSPYLVFQECLCSFPGGNKLYSPFRFLSGWVFQEPFMLKIAVRNELNLQKRGRKVELAFLGIENMFF